MTDAPERIWAWIDDIAGIVGTAWKPETPDFVMAGPNALTPATEYICAAAVQAMIDAAVKEERERAAKVAERYISTDTDWDNSFWNQCAERIAFAIRGDT